MTDFLYYKIDWAKQFEFYGLEKCRIWGCVIGRHCHGRGAAEGYNDILLRWSGIVPGSGVQGELCQLRRGLFACSDDILRTKLC